ncbi:acetyltransferase domain-containing protein, putative [Babesia caballi]|uniref:Acetyltransferase domain-containing protein, putative n=1 Tax=Babesia caballi TaxID=5871 RepID=A0AAV4LQV9_BABCB|nr:acetyltransferase domain-containing protein, putative [Babesia caballi]
MGSSVDVCTLLERKVLFSEEFEANGLRLLFKQLESYEEYLAARPLVEMLSRCSIIHGKDYVNAMLRLPSYYPFVVYLLGEGSANAAAAEAASASDRNGEVRTPAPTDERREINIIGYIEVYTLPHLGRLFDSRLERVVVDPRYRNHGVCQKMITLALRFCSSFLHCNRVDLICDNPVAMHIYEKFGFVEVKTNTYRKTLS